MEGGWIQSLVGGLVGFGSAVCAEPCRAWIFRSRLDLKFDPNAGCLIETFEKREAGIDPTGIIVLGEDAKYVRLSIRNTRWQLARGVRVFLHAIDGQNYSGEFRRTEYADILQLGWSGRTDDRFSAIDLPRGVTAFVDLVSSRRSKPYSMRPEVSSWPARWGDLIMRKGVYRFEVIATADNARPARSAIVLSWNAQWESLRFVSAAEAHIRQPADGR